ncbi:hypothetical protein JHK85_000006 [Glycine max]|nr:hypothetical protein JHK85_000006 [Glycine max]
MWVPVLEVVAHVVVVGVFVCLDVLFFFCLLPDSYVAPLDVIWILLCLDSKEENFKCFGGKLMQKFEEKVEDWDSSLSAQNRPNTSARLAANLRFARRRPTKKPKNVQGDQGYAVKHVGGILRTESFDEGVKTVYGPRQKSTVPGWNGSDSYRSLSKISSRSSIESSAGNTFAEDVSYLSNLCQVESSLRVEDDNIETTYFVRRTFVSEAMKMRYVVVSMCTPLIEVIDLMLAEKQSCVVIVDTDDTLIGFLTLRDIQEYGKFAKAKKHKT